MRDFTAVPDRCLDCDKPMVFDEMAVSLLKYEIPVCDECMGIRRHEDIVDLKIKDL